MKHIKNIVSHTKETFRSRVLAREHGGDTVEYAFVAVVAIICGVAVLAFGNAIVTGIESAAAQAGQIFGNLSA